MAAPDVARRRYRARVRLADALVDDARPLWRQLSAADLDGWYRQHGPRLVVLLAATQLAAARGADVYLDEVLEAQDIDPTADAAVNPAAFAGVASDGRTLDGLLASPTIAAKEAIAAGATSAQAVANGWATLETILRTQVADAGRVADGTALTARKRVGGYVRMLSLPSCPRCVVQAGKWFRWNAGFQRHPRCDCVHIPSSEDRAGDLRTDPLAAVRAGQVQGITRAERQAILDGADPSQVINAKRGLRTTVIGGRRVKITSEGTTKRGFSTAVRRELAAIEGQQLEFVGRNVGRRGAVANYTERRVRRPRLTPEEIYRVSGGSRDEALRLLARNGYLLNVPGQRNSLIPDLAQFAART